MKSCLNKLLNKSNPKLKICNLSFLINCTILNSHEQEIKKNGVQNSILKEQKPTRDMLKAKFQEKETKTVPSITSINQLPTHQAPLKTVEKLSFSFIDDTPKKITNEPLVKSQINNQTNYQKITPDKEKKKSLNSQTSTYIFSSKAYSVFSDKILLRSSQKQASSEVNISPPKELGNMAQGEQNTAPLKSHLREVLVNALKKNTSNSSPLKKKDNAFTPIIKLLIERSDTPKSNQSKMNNDGTKSPSLISKNKKDNSSVSPFKKQSNENYEKPIIESKSEVITNVSRKSTPLPIFLSEEEKIQYGDRSLPDYEKLELLGK